MSKDTWIAKRPTAAKARIPVARFKTQKTEGKQAIPAEKLPDVYRQEQSRWLDNERLSTEQLQARALQVGEFQGNASVRRLVMQRQNHQAPDPDQAKNPLPKAHLRPKQQGRAYILDWESQHLEISQNDKLRTVFLEQLPKQLKTFFGESITQEQVLKRIEQADTEGRTDEAQTMRANLFKANQYAVVETLSVDKSQRYQPQEQPSKTFCNIYTYDMVTALGGYLPRVWWNANAITRLQKGETVQPIYSKTVHEMNANALTDWMHTYGGSFGWRQAQDINAAQTTANQGNLVILLAARTDPKRSGHVNVIMPETEQHQAKHDGDGNVARPLQSQAGSKNFKYQPHSKQWWEAKGYRGGAAWIFVGQPGSPLLTPEQLGRGTIPTNKAETPATPATNAQPVTPKPKPAGHTNQGAVRNEVVQNIEQHAAIIDRVAVEEGIHPNLVRGIMAAESGGRASVGAASGYKGLMQAGRDNEQLDPETSIRTGIRKYKAFARGLQNFLTKHGADPATLTGTDVIRRVMVAYNAGPGTVKKAMEYALAAGDQRLERWLEPEHFQRALLYYGAYDVKGLLRRALTGLDGDALASELSTLVGKHAGELRTQYFVAGKWNVAQLRTAITTAVNDQRKQLRKKNLTLEEAQTQASHWIIQAVVFKHNNLRAWYVDRVLHYMDYFNQTRPVQEIVIGEPEVIEAD